MKVRPRNPNHKDTITKQKKHGEVLGFSKRAQIFVHVTKIWQHKLRRYKSCKMLKSTPLTLHRGTSKLGLGRKKRRVRYKTSRKERESEAHQLYQAKTEARKQMTRRQEHDKDENLAQSHRKMPTNYSQ